MSAGVVNLGKLVAARPALANPIAGNMEQSVADSSADCAGPARTDCLRHRFQTAASHGDGLRIVCVRTMHQARVSETPLSVLTNVQSEPSLSGRKSNAAGNQAPSMVISCLDEKKFTAGTIAQSSRLQARSRGRLPCAISRHPHRAAGATISAS